MSATGARPPRSWDFFLTTFLILLLLVITGIFVALGVGFGLATLGCADPTAACDGGAIGLGAQLAAFGTPLVALIAVIVSIVLISRRKVAFLVPIVGIVVASALYLLGASTLIARR